MEFEGTFNFFMDKQSSVHKLDDKSLNLARNNFWRYLSLGWTGMSRCIWMSTGMNGLGQNTIGG